MDLAALHLKGPAKVWFNRYILGRRNVMWEEFILDVCESFRDNRGCTVAEDFNPLQHSVTLEAYSTRAEELKAHSLVRNPLMPDFHYGESLFAGLKPTIQSFEKCEKVSCELYDEIYSTGHKCKKIGSNYLTILVDEAEDYHEGCLLC